MSLQHKIRLLLGKRYNMNYKVAVVIPTLNEEKFIARCLDSVIAQSYPFNDIDVMVVDGGSKDRTREIVQRISEQHSNVRLIDNPGRIQSIAFNIGVKNSDAPYIVRLDAHATYNKVYIEKCLKIFSAKAEVLGCAPELIGNVGGVCSIRPQHSAVIAETSAILNQVKFGIGGAAFRVGAKAGFVDTVPFGCFPRRVIDEIGGMREDLARGEDNEYNSRIHKAGYKVYLNPEVVCTYFSRDTIRANMKQMYANGVSIGKLLHIDRASVGLRHLVPLAFVLSLIGSLILGCIYTPVFLLFALIIGLYAFAAIAATISACMKFGWKYCLTLPLMFFLVHVSYGWGTIVGLYKR